MWAKEESVVDVETQRAVVLTGNRNTAEDGNLWWTENLGAADQSWTPVLTDDEIPLSLGASKHFDECGELGSKPIGSGQLIVADTWGSTTLLVASAAAATRGLWEVDSAAPSSATFAYLNASLPDAIPAALALDASGDYLLVGFRPVLSTVLSNLTSLYLCPGDFTASSESCIPVGDDADVVWSGDVRDIEAHPSIPGLFYVADGGRRSDGSGCDTGESTVYAVEVSGSFPSPSVDLVDTDDDALAVGSSWTQGATYYAAKNCQSGASGNVAGELVPPIGQGSEGSELSSIAVDPSGEFLFAFYPLRDNRREYGCVATYRSETADIGDQATPWLPFQGWEDQKMSFSPGSSGGTDNLHPSTRASHVGVTGSATDYDAFMVAEPLLASWAGAGTHDAAFVAGSSSYDLLLGGNFIWRVFAEDPGVGWNTATPLTGTGGVDYDSIILDEAEWELAWDGESPVFQDASVTSVASCPGCEQAAGGVTDSVLVSGILDYKMARLHGVDSAGDRPAADRQCEVHSINTSGGSVSIWPGDANSIAQAWMALNPQDSSSVLDTKAARGLMYLDDLSQDDRWCWDAMTTSGTDGLTNGNYIRDSWNSSTGLPGTDGLYEMQCQDSSLIAAYSGGAIPGEWLDACVQTTVMDPYNMADADMGQVRSLAPFDDAATLAAAAPGEDVGVSTTVGEGLWIIRYTGVTGLSYQHIAFPSAGLHGGSTCTEDDFFEWTSQVKVVFHSVNFSTGYIRAFLSSRNADCGVAEVVLDPTGAAAPVWTAVNLALGPDTCDIDNSQLRGVSLSRDGRWLMAFGGPHTTSAGGGVCAVDLKTSYATFNAVGGATEDLQFEEVLPHPHVDDTFFAVGYWSNGVTSDPGVYLIERRWRFGTFGGSWQWRSRRLSGDDLEQRTVLDLDWGAGFDATGAGLLRHLYLATAGGGPIDGTVEVE